MTVYEALWTFFLFSFVGWCSEVAFAACKTGHFVNRGFLMGPVCPIYGCGVVAVYYLIAPIRPHLFQAYVVAVMVPTVIEYFVGWFSYRVLHTRLWDYSRMPLNIGGHVCLLFSLIWGVGCMVVVYLLQPLVLKMVVWIPALIGWIALGVFSVTILTDLILTGIQAAKLPAKWKAVEEMEAGLRRISDGIGSSLSEKTLALWDRDQEKREEFLNSLGTRKQEFLAQREALLEKYRKQLEKPSKFDIRLTKAFPHIKKTEESHHLEWVRDLYRQRKEK